MATLATEPLSTFRANTARSWWFARSSDAADNVEGLVRSYAQGIYITARGMSLQDDDAFARIAQEAAALTDSQVEQKLPDVLALETRLFRTFGADDRRLRHWDFRERFERIATAGQLAAYRASNPPKLEAGAEPPTDADTLVLLDHIHRSYILTLVREGSVRDLKQWVQNGLKRGMIAIGVLVILAFAIKEVVSPLVNRLVGQAIEGSRRLELVPEPLLYFCLGLLTLYFLGRLGAAMSVIQRLQRAVREQDKDPFFEVTALCTGRRGISISMLSGGVFALLLYVVFGAGLGLQLGFSGGLFPRVGNGSDAEVAAGVQVEQDQADEVEDSGQKTEPGSAIAPPISPAPQTALSGATPEAVPAADTQASNSMVAPDAASRTVQSAAEKPSTQPQAGPCGTDKTDCMPTWVTDIGKHLGFRSYPDFFKMLLLAFLAGFAERLVPDALDRLTRRHVAGDPEPAGTPSLAGGPSVA